MISVIVPTMLKEGIELAFEYTINEMQKNDLIDEILIIKNTDKDFFKTLNIKYTGKIKIIYEGENLFVNPSWNLGIEQIKNEVFCIINDDVICHSTNFTKCYNKVIEDDIGLVTTRTALHFPIQAYEKSPLHKNKPEFSEDIPNGRQGWFFFGKKENWINIPKELKVFFGDDFLYYMHRRNNKTNVILENGFVGHFESTTAKEYFHYNDGGERAIYQDLIKRIENNETDY
jgi:hypothetical protein